MSIRVKLTSDLVSTIRIKLNSRTESDIFNVVENAFDNHETLTEIHKAVKNGHEYRVTRGTYDTPFAAETSIVDMDDKLYLLTDRLHEIENLLDNHGHHRRAANYYIRDSNWD